MGTCTSKQNRQSHEYRTTTSNAYARYTSDLHRFGTASHVDIFTRNAADIKEVRFRGFRPLIYLHGHTDDVATGEDENGYFRQQGIQIRKLATSMHHMKKFWITKQGDLYSQRFGVATPTKISALRNVLDVVAADDYAIALCAPSIVTTNDTINHWFRDDSALCAVHGIIPSVIIAIISHYAHTNQLYVLRASHGESWTLLESLQHVTVTKIAAGSRFTLFWDSCGSVYSCGCNGAGQLGLGENCDIDYDNYQDPKYPMAISMPFAYHRKIVDIQCGQSHVLCLDDAHTVYAWGANKYGECGVSYTGTSLSVASPVCVTELDGVKVVGIKCGGSHSCCFDSEGKHYFWGNNQYNQCVVDTDGAHIDSPRCVDDFFMATKQQQIKEVFLGRYVTFVIGQ